MFSALQQRTWTTTHLLSGAWYLDCGTAYTPPSEVELKKSREAIGESGEEMLDLNSIEDENAREKAMRKRLESDRKKALKVKEAEEKAQQKEKERLDREAEKAARKGKKKVTTPGGSDDVMAVPAASAINSGSRAHSEGTRGTKRGSAYEQLIQVPFLPSPDNPEFATHEFFWNSSLDDLLGGQSGELPPSYNALKEFLSSVRVVQNFPSNFSSPN